MPTGIKKGSKAKIGGTSGRSVTNTRKGTVISPASASKKEARAKLKEGKKALKQGQKAAKKSGNKPMKGVAGYF